MRLEHVSVPAATSKMAFDWVITGGSARVKVAVVRRAPPLKVKFAAVFPKQFGLPTSIAPALNVVPPVYELDVLVRATVPSPIFTNGPMPEITPESVIVVAGSAEKKPGTLDNAIGCGIVVVAIPSIVLLPMKSTRPEAAPKLAGLLTCVKLPFSNMVEVKLLVPLRATFVLSIT
jgi:hypothetical protein